MDSENEENDSLALLLEEAQDSNETSQEDVNGETVAQKEKQMTMDDALKRIKELEEELMKVKRKNKVKRSRENQVQELNEENEENYSFAQRKVLKVRKSKGIQSLEDSQQVSNDEKNVPQKDFLALADEKLRQLKENEMKEKEKEKEKEREREKEKQTQKLDEKESEKENDKEKGNEVKEIEKNQEKQFEKEEHNKEKKRKYEGLGKIAPAEAGYDEISGYRLSERFVQPKELKNMIEGKEVVKISQVFERFEKVNPKSDWVLVGIIGKKGEIKQGKKGKSFVNWQLTDLKENFIYLTLFESAFERFWKLIPSTIIFVLNPTIFRKKEGSDSFLSLNISNADVIKAIGTSFDFYRCIYTKDNTQQCNKVISKKDKYCKAHLNYMLRQSQNSRRECSLSTAPFKDDDTEIKSKPYEAIISPKKEKREPINYQSKTVQKSLIETAKTFCEKNGLDTIRTGVLQQQVISGHSISNKKMDSSFIKKIGFNPSERINSREPFPKTLSKDDDDFISFEVIEKPIKKIKTDHEANLESNC